MIAAALVAIPAVFLETSKSSSASSIGEILGAAVWMVFAVEVVWLLTLTGDRRRWIAGHHLELFVALTTVPLLPKVDAVRSLVGIVPVFELFKLFKVVKLMKLGRLLRRSRALGTLTARLVGLAIAVLALGLVGASVSERKLATPWHGVMYVIDSIGDSAGLNRYVVAGLLALVLFAAVEWWAGGSLIGAISRTDGRDEPPPDQHE